MRNAYLVALPPGAGKTRAVLKRLLCRVGGNWATLCKNLLVLGPNPRVEHVWLRELAILATANKSDEEAIRRLKPGPLRQRLGRMNLTLHFRTFRNLKGNVRLRPFAFIVLDEWHRYRGTRSCLLAKARKGPLGNHTYFVSATPLNPVMEERRDVLVEDPNDDEDSITECREHALQLISELTKIPINEQIKSQKFSLAIKTMGVQWLHWKTGWKAPRIAKPRPQDAKLSGGELDGLSRARKYGDTPDWKSSEAAWALGLVRTKYDRNRRIFLLNHARGGKKLVFGHPYIKTHLLKEVAPSVAARWLWKKHCRVPRLISLLNQCGVISPVEGSDEFKLTKTKGLVFCVHQGVARGLQLALQAAIPSHDGGIACAVHEFTDEHQNAFMQRGKPPYILIATDKLSESIDLHGACSVLIHYELPWSPLRLLQRVGRLTRIGRNGSFKETKVHHIVIPYSVEEERVNRLIRRSRLLHDEGAWPVELYNGSRGNSLRIARALIGSGPSMHLAEEVSSARCRQ